MNFKTAKVIGHPRSGSHYLAHLLNINFFCYPTYLPLYGGHSNSHKNWLKDSSIAVFYIYRNNNSTIDSMYNLRNRFGLVADSIEEFKNSKLSDMHDKNIKSEAICNIQGNKQIVTDVDTYFKNINKTPEEFLNSHKEFWLSENKNNFLSLRYEDLLNDFEHTMKLIAWFLNSEAINFIQEKERVGWYSKDEPPKKFS